MAPDGGPSQPVVAVVATLDAMVLDVRASRPVAPSSKVRGRAGAALAGAVALVAGAWALVALFRLEAERSWYGDAIGVGMPVLVATSSIGVVAAIMLRWRWAVVVTAAATLAGTWVVVAPRLPLSSGRPTDPLEIAAVNLRFDNHHPDEGVDDVLARHPAIVVVSELSRRTDPRFVAAYPYHAVVWGPAYGQGVYSTVPLRAVTAPAGVGRYVEVEVLAARPFILIGVHLPRPQIHWNGSIDTTSFATQRDQVAVLDLHARAQVLPTVIAGDLNLSDRTNGYRVLTTGRLDATRVRSWAATSYVGSLGWSVLQLRIDHILLSHGWCAAHGRSFAISGSDHRGVSSEIGPCATG